MEDVGRDRREVGRFEGDGFDRDGLERHRVVAADPLPRRPADDPDLVVLGAEQALRPPPVAVVVGRTS
jgi:hypothetical protein